jgi:hypothetical protein
LVNNRGYIVYRSKSLTDVADMLDRYSDVLPGATVRLVEPPVNEHEAKLQCYSNLLDTLLEVAR